MSGIYGQDTSVAADAYDEDGWPLAELEPAEVLSPGRLAHEPPRDDGPPSILARLRSGAWLDAEVFPAMSWAVPGLIPEGMGLLTGPPKAGKSWCALGIGLAVASGGRALGRVPVGGPRPVLLLALEDGPRRLQGRCRELLAGEPIPAGLDFLTTATPAEVLEVIGAWLEVHGHARPLVILDTLGKVMPPALPGEGAYQRDYRIGSRLKALADAHPGTCLLVVHHTRKAASEDWMDSTSGTNGLNGAADFTLNLSRNRNEDTGVVRVTGRDVPEGEHAITSASGAWTLDGDTLAEAARRAAEVKAAAGLGDTSAELLRLVGEHPEGIGPTAAAEALGEMTAANAGTYLARLEAAGRIVKLRRGVYGPLSTPVESVESVESVGAISTDSTLSTPPLGEDCPVCGVPLHAGRCVRCEVEGRPS